MKIHLNKEHMNPHWSILRENERRSEHRIGLTAGHTWDLWNVSIWAIPAYEGSDLDKCVGWVRSSLTCYVLKYSWFESLAHSGQTWREETLARRETWRSASWQRQHVEGTPFTNAMLCKTEQAKIILHSIPPAGPRQSHLPFSNPKQLHCDLCVCVRALWKWLHLF